MRDVIALIVAVVAGAGGCAAPSPPPMVGKVAKVTLFDGVDASRWTQMDGAPCEWEIDGGELIVRPSAGSIRTRDGYTDFSLHVEFCIPQSPPDVTGQGRGNSGIYLQNRYEVQILDSWGLAPSTRDCGALYGRVAPRVNASRPPGAWQEYEIEFTAARFDASGQKTANARITVRHNGILIHDDVELEGKTGAGAPEAPTPGPIVLQDHGNRVRFRNLQIGATPH